MPAGCGRRTRLPAGHGGVHLLFVGPDADADTARRAGLQLSPGLLVLAWTIRSGEGS